jgi:hypothetical protein
MHRLKRIPPPVGFEAAAQPLRQTARGSAPKPRFNEGFWTRYKAELSDAQHRKCGYCEMRAIGPAYGDVDHYRPKGAVWEIESPGAEVRNLATVAGRKPKKLSATGYWWAAYDWDNWLLACGICNQAWKLSYFPVSDSPRVLPPTEGVDERPLLLNPFDGPHPAKHLKFGRLGEVEPRRNSARGRATIDVCGLDRPSLRESRLEIADRVYRLIDRVADTANPQRVADAIVDIHEAGDERAVHCGMVRAIFEDETGMSWKQLEEKVAALGS